LLADPDVPIYHVGVAGAISTPVSSVDRIVSGPSPPQFSAPVPNLLSDSSDDCNIFDVGLQPPA